MIKHHIYLLFFSLIFTACKSSKIAVNKSTIKNISAKKVIKNINAADFDKKTVDAKLKVNYKTIKEDVGFSIQMKIKKNEVIYLKGTKVITVFKAKITPKEVSFYSPYKKNYFKGDFSILKKILGTDINFNQLQNLLLGQPMKDINSGKQEIVIVENSYRLRSKNQPNLFDFFFFVNPNHFKLNKQSLINASKNQQLDIKYLKYLEKDNTLFPEKIIINSKNNNKFTNINVYVRSVVFNTSLNMPFSIPSGYKQIKL